MDNLLRDQSYMITGNFAVQPMIPFYFVDAGSGNINISLLPVTQMSNSNGKQTRLQLKRIDLTANEVIITPPSGVKIEWSDNYSLPAPQSVTLFSDRKNYYVQRGAASPQSDWNAEMGPAAIVNKPTGLSYFTNDVGFIGNSGLSNYATSSSLASGLAQKEGILLSGNTGQFFRGDKTWANLNGNAVGLGNVNNTSDSAKPISTLQQAALNLKFNIPSGNIAQYINGTGGLTSFPSNVSSFFNDVGYLLPANLTGYPTTAAFNSGLALKEPIVTSGTTGQYYRGDKVFAALNSTAVGLGNVNNTSDSNKPISVLQQSGLDLKFNNPSGTTGQYIRGDGSLANFSFTSSLVFNNSPVRVPVTVAAAANGWQIDANRAAIVTYSVTITSASTLLGGQAGYSVLEICPTNSAVAANWIEIGRSGDGQSNGLIVGLALNQIGGGSVFGVVPGGWFVRIRNVATTGAPTFAYNSGQEIKI